MKRAALALLVAVGCKSDEKPPLAPASAMIAKFEAITEKMCSCADPACAEAARMDMNRWSAERVKTASTTAPPSAAESQRLQDAAKRYSGCMARVTAPR